MIDSKAKGAAFSYRHSPMKLRFSIRDLAWLTLVVALLMVWWIDHRNLAARNRFTVETVRSSDGEPIVLRDNHHSDVVLIRDEEGWKVGVSPGHKNPPVFKPEE
jgi:hypothetical protein